MKIRVILFKQQKLLFKQQYQTGPHSLYKCSSYQIHQSANLSSVSSKQHLGIKLPHPPWALISLLLCTKVVSSLRKNLKCFLFSQAIYVFRAYNKSNQILIFSKKMYRRRQIDRWNEEHHPSDTKLQIVDFPSHKENFKFSTDSGQ